MSELQGQHIGLTFGDTELMLFPQSRGRALLGMNVSPLGLFHQVASWPGELSEPKWTWEGWPSPQALLPLALSPEERAVSRGWGGC